MPRVDMSAHLGAPRLNGALPLVNLGTGSADARGAKGDEPASRRRALWRAGSKILATALAPVAHMASAAAVAVACLLAGVVAGPSPAGAATSCSAPARSGNTATATWSFTGRMGPWTVPPGVHSVVITAAGAHTGWERHT